MDKDHAFITPLSVIEYYWYDDDKRESIPYEDFEEKCCKVPLDNYLNFLTGEFVNELF